jgi:methionyl-tRNA formyltransferase
MRQAAVDAAIAIYDPDNVNLPEGIDLVRSLDPQLLVVCDYGQILKPEVLATPSRGAVNLHGSLLPKYRGAAPVNWAILRGEAETGVTVIQMTDGLDAGPILARRCTPIGIQEDAVMLEGRLAELGVSAVMESIDLLEQWDGKSPLGEPQNADEATRARRLRKTDAEIDWSWSSTKIRNRVRGLVPWPGTFTQWTNERGDTQRLIIRRVAVVESPSNIGQAGEIVSVSNDQLQVACGDGQTVSLLEVQPSGKKVMSAAEFLRGYRLKVGQKLQ